MTCTLDSTEVASATAMDQFDAGCVSLMDRWQPMTEWYDERLKSGLDATCKANACRIGPRVVARDRAGRGLAGINMASQDFLSLASHPKILAAASAAARRYGVHSAGTAVQMGLTTLTTSLEERIAAFVGMAQAIVFPSGWTAGFGAIRALVRPGDHVLVDAHARECLQDGAAASGATVHQIQHGSTEALVRRLERLRDEDPQAGIIVVTEALFAMEPGSASLPELQQLCRRYAATLLVDVANDLGALGATGRGVCEMQGILGGIDILTGSFSKTFAANGGFVASNHPALRLAMRVGSSVQGCSNAISPLQAAVVLAALEIVDSEEGAERRNRLMQSIERLRTGLEDAGFEVTGAPGAVVTVRLGRLACARRLTADMLSRGALLNLTEPLTPGSADALWRLKLLADHGTSEVDGFVAIAREAKARLDEENARSAALQYAVA